MADLERLVVSLEANIKKFESEMKKARDVTDRSMSDVESRTGEMAAGVESALDRAGARAASAFAGAFAKGMAGGLATALTAWIGQGISGLADLQEQARRTQMAVEELAGLQFAGNRKGVDTSTMGADLAKLGKSVADEIRNEEGQITKLFEANGLKLTDAEGRMRSIRDILADIAGLVANANSEWDRMEILKVVGLSEKYLAMLRQGSEALNESVNEGNRLAGELGAAAAKAEEFKARWDEAWANFSAGGKTSLMVIMDLLQGAVNLAERLGAKLQANAVNQKIANGGVQSLNLPDLEYLERFAKANNAFLTPQMAQRMRDLRAVGGLPSGLSPADPGTLQEQLRAQQARQAPAVPPERPRNIAGRGGTIIPPKDDESSSGKTAARKRNEFDTEERGMQRRIRTLGAEAEAIGKSGYEAARAEAEFRLLDAAKQAGVQNDEKVIASIARLSDAYANAKVKVDQAKQAFAKAQELGNFGGTELITLLKGATQGMEGLAQAARKVADNILDAVLQAAVLGKGPFSGLMGTSGEGGNVGGLIGLLMKGFVAAPAQAGGGWIGDGPASIVPASLFSGARSFAKGGKVTPILAHDGELILNAAQQRNLTANMGGGGVDVKIINNAGAQVTPARSRGADGRTMLTFLLEGVKKDMATGGFDGVNRGRFGLAPTGVRR